MGPIAAIRAFSATLGRDPRQKLEKLVSIANAYPKSFLAQNRAASQAWCDREYEIALSFAERAEVLEPNSFSTLMILAAVHIEMGNEEKAYGYAKRLLQSRRMDRAAWQVTRLLLAPFRLISRVPKGLDNAFSQLTSTGDSWVSWAKEFVAEYEARKNP